MKKFLHPHCLLVHKVQDIGLALALEIELALVLEIAIVSTSARE